MHIMCPTHVLPVTQTPACTALLQYDVIAYRRKKGVTDKYVYQFQMIRREGQGPLLSEVSPSLYWFVIIACHFPLGAAAWEATPPTWRPGGNAGYAAPAHAARPPAAGLPTSTCTCS